jgi:hypothetical protein
VNLTQAIVDERVIITEEWGARSPGWYIAECQTRGCGATTTGCGQACEDWAWEHVADHIADELDCGFPG